MPLNEKEIRRISSITFLLVLIALAFIIVRPILISIVGGLLLAYVLNPLYQKINRRLLRPTFSALIVCALIVLILFIPLWFVFPLIIKQTFDMFSFLQVLDVGAIISTLFSGIPQQVLAETTAIISSSLSQATASSLNSLIQFLLDLPTLLLHGAVVVFVFFFALRDQEKLKEYAEGLSPLSKTQEKVLVKEFQDITSSLIYGYIIIGVIQGIATGIGLLIFGVPRALLLTIFAIFASIFPLVGPWLIWLPAAIYLFSTGDMTMALGFTLYSMLVVSSLDNFLRPYIVSRRSNISPVVAMVGMIGGLFVFGVLGIIIGPLILAYLVIFLTAYRDKTIASMFSD